MSQRMSPAQQIGCALLGITLLAGLVAGLIAGLIVGASL